MLFVYTLFALFLAVSSVHGLPFRRLHAANATTIPSQAPTNATAGCSQVSPFQFDDTNHANITHGGRSFLVHIPANYDPKTPHALVVSYHGFKSNAKEQELITGLSAQGLTLNGKGIVAVYPEGQFGPGKNGNESIRAWQGAPYSSPGVDDIAFTQEMVRKLSDNLCLDSNRFFATGKSNGGGFTNLLACTPATASLFAAFAPVSPALYAGANPTDCAPGRPVPIINFHGLADNVIPFNGQAADEEGRTEYATPNITQFREAWAARNGCGAAPSPSTIGSAAAVKLSSSGSVRLSKAPVVSHPHVNTTLKAFACDAMVKGYSVEGLGHSWPNTAGLDGGETTFNATGASILPFFDTYALPLH